LTEYFVGVDSGTQGTKALVVDGESGRVVGSAFRAMGLIEGLPPGHREHHPSSWIDAFIETVREAVKVSGVEPAKIRGLGVSAQQHGFVPLDGEGNVIRPAKLWNDTSTAEECKMLTDALGGERKVIRLIGNTIPPGFTAGKILWLKRHEPGNFRRLRTVLLPHDYLNLWLTGRCTMEYGDASGTALMDVRRRRWSEEVAEAIDPALIEKLPKLNPSDEPAGQLRREAAETLGLRDVLVSAGGGDNMMGAIGTGNTRPGIVTVSLGTSGTVYAYSERPVVDPKGEVAAFCDSTNGWLPLVCTMNVTVATDLVKRLFKYSFEGLEEAVAGSQPGSGGLLLLPYLGGERTPNVPEGTGVLYGVSADNLTAPNIARSAMEGVTMGLNYGFNRLRGLGIDPKEVRLTGGAARNRTWRSIAADVFNVEVACIGVEEGASYGAALQSMWTYRRAGGERTSISEITDAFVKLDEGSRVRPNPRNTERYSRLQRLQDRLSLDLRRTFQADKGLRAP
jgi:xylulokinase